MCVLEVGVLCKNGIVFTEPTCQVPYITHVEKGLAAMQIHQNLVSGGVGGSVCGDELLKHSLHT